MIVVDMSGRILESGNLANSAGYYLYSDEAIEQMIAEGRVPCGSLDENGEYNGLRPGFMIVGTDENGQPIKIDTCAGQLIENHLPDVVLIDNAWKPYVKYVNAAVLLFVVVLIVKELR